MENIVVSLTKKNQKKGRTKDHPAGSFFVPLPNQEPVRGRPQRKEKFDSMTVPNQPWTKLIHP
jgi:hypothetical protein